MAYPPQGAPVAAGEVVAPKLPINYFKHTFFTRVDWTRRYQPVMTLDRAFTPIYVYLRAENIDYAYDFNYNLVFIYNDGTSVTVDSDVVPPKTSKLFSKPVHDIEDYLTGNKSLFAKLKDGVYVTRIELYGWFTYLPPTPYAGLLTLYLLGVRW